MPPTTTREPATKERDRKKTVPPPPPLPDLETYAEEGDIVHWLPSATRGERPTLAMVSRLGVESVSLNCFHPDLHDMHLWDAVYHVDNPKARAAWNTQGGWVHKPFTIAARRMMLQLGHMAWHYDGNWHLVPAAAEPEPKAAEVTKPAA